MRHPAVFPGAVVCAGLIGFIVGMVYSDRDLRPPRSSAPATDGLHLPANEQVRPAKLTKDNYPQSIDALSAAVHAADAKAREMMKREGVSSGATGWVCHFVNRGLKDIPDVSDEDLRAARTMLTRNEVIEWISAAFQFAWNKAGMPPP